MIMRALETIRYNDGKGTVKSMTHSMFSASGSLLKTLEYNYTYGDPAKGEIPDTLYKYEIGSGIDFTFVYDDLARLTYRNLITDSINKTESYTYKVSDRGTNWTTPLVEEMTDFAGVQHVYTYDANGNITSDTYGGYTVSYEYDSLNRMTRYNDPVYGWTYVYVYDDRGNITEMQEHQYTTAETLDEPLHVYEYEYGDGTWADLMTSYWGEDIEYDELGNPQNWINGETLEWDNGRQLVSYDGSVNYTYNADGLRTGKSGDRNTEYYIVNGTYLGETTTINGTSYTLSYFYDENGSIAGLWHGSTVYYFAKNLQGDVTAILDYQGNVIANYRYDAYGSIISVTDANGNYVSSATHIANLNPFRYRGYMYDEESEFYYLRSRYYDPYIGRFLNADGLVSTGTGLGGFNMFAYCNGNPIINYDPTGCRHEMHSGLVGSSKRESKLEEILSTTYTCPMVIPSSNDLVSMVADTTLGATARVLSNQTTQVPAIINEKGYVQYAPSGGYTVPKYPGLTTTLNKTGTVLTVATVVFDVGNTFTAHNNNTLGRRFTKAGIQITGAAASVGVGYLAVAAANCWNPGGWVMIAAAGATFVVISLVGSYAIYEGQEYLYEVLEIE